MKESCTVYSLIFMLGRNKRRGPHILLCIQLWISSAAFSSSFFLYSFFFCFVFPPHPFWEKISRFDSDLSTFKRHHYAFLAHSLNVHPPSRQCTLPSAVTAGPFWIVLWYVEEDDTDGCFQQTSLRSLRAACPCWPVNRTPGFCTFQGGDHILQSHISFQ